MNVRAFTILLGASGVLLAASGPAATADNPYDKIVVRNLFGLKDPPEPPPPGSDKPAPPPITLQGFTTILGKNQVLFKVAMPAKPPQPASEVSKIMTEGERDGDITVLEINLAEHSVKFDNYGTVEVKNLKDHAAKPTGAPVNVAGGGIPQPGMPQPGMPQPIPAPPGGGAATPLPTYAANPAGTVGTSARATGLQSLTKRETRGTTTTPYGVVATQNSPPSSPSSPGVNWPPERHLTPEEQEALIALQQQLHKDDPNFPTVPGSYVPPNKQNQTPTPNPRPQ